MVSIYAVKMRCKITHTFFIHKTFGNIFSYTFAKVPENHVL